MKKEGSEGVNVTFLTFDQFKVIFIELNYAF